MTARAEIVVDLAAIRHNVRLLKELTGTQVMTVVKADGYGHGMAESARAAREGGADWLGVATIDEALALREAGDTGRVLCWLTVPGDDWGAAIEQDIDVTVYSEAELDEVVATGRQARVQLKVDTGLNRGGAPLRRGTTVRGRVRPPARPQDPDVTGIWSHFSSSDEPDDPANDAQEAAFHDALDLAAGCRARGARGAPPRQLRGGDPATQLQAGPGARRHRVVRPRPGTRASPATSGCGRR